MFTPIATDQLLSWLLILTPLPGDRIFFSWDVTAKGSHISAPTSAHFQLGAMATESTLGMGGALLTVLGIKPETQDMADKHSNIELHLLLVFVGSC